MTINFDNPWSDSSGFIDLGEYRINYSKDIGKPNELYDLYALVENNGKTVHFGARYGDEGSYYISGDARLYDDEWNFFICAVTAVAAGRYFANHHNKEKVNGTTIINYTGCAVNDECAGQ